MLVMKQALIDWLIAFVFGVSFALAVFFNI